MLIFLLSPPSCIPPLLVGWCFSSSSSSSSSSSASAALFIPINVPRNLNPIFHWSAPRSSTLSSPLLPTTRFLFLPPLPSRFECFPIGHIRCFGKHPARCKPKGYLNFHTHSHFFPSSNTSMNFVQLKKVFLHFKCN